VPVWRRPRRYSLVVRAVGHERAEEDGAAAGVDQAGGLGVVLRRLASYPYRLNPDGYSGVGDADEGRSSFARLAVVQGLSAAGDAMLAVALAGSIFFNVSARAAESRVALSLALTVAPFAVVGPLLGALVEHGKGGRRSIIAASALGRATCCFLMAYWAHSVVLFPIAFFSLVFSKLYMVTKAAVVPGTVDRPQHLVLANSKLAVGGSATGLVAGGLAVGLLDIFGTPGLLRCAIAVYLACAWSATRLLVAPSSPVGRGTDQPRARVEEPASPEPAPVGLPPGGLQLAAVATGGLRAATGFVFFLLVFTFRRDSAPLIWYGIALGASQVGNVVGALLAPRLRRRGREEWMLTASSLVMGLGALGTGLVNWGREWLVAVALSAGIGLAASAGKLAFDSMVQRDVPSRVRAKSFARFESGFQLAWAFGSLLAVLVPMSLSAGFITVGGVGLLGAVAFAGGSVRARRGTLPKWWPGAAPRPVARASGAMSLDEGRKAKPARPLANNSFRPQVPGGTRRPVGSGG